jgi:hypothetical protein
MMVTAVNKLDNFHLDGVRLESNSLIETVLIELRRKRSSTLYALRRKCLESAPGWCLEPVDDSTPGGCL